MKIVVLGTAGYHPNDTRDTSCFLIPELGFVLDAGTGMHRLGKLLVGDTLDIFLSHAHLDHVFGLTFLLGVGVTRSMRRITVHGIGATLQAIDRHLYSEALFPVRPNFNTQAFSTDPFTVGDCRITPMPLAHPGGSIGFRFDWPEKSLAYVTDTTAHVDADYVARIRGVDLLIHECNFRDQDREWAVKTGHSCTSDVARVAAKAEVGRLLLTHFNPIETSSDPIGIEQARAIFARTDLAFDGMTLEF
ncbi:MAG: Ribonuclease [Planctomycetota bacterium]|jgi:ribonuclease BN (tRNA processing enzyme)